MNYTQMAPILEQYQISLTEDQWLANTKKTVVVGMSGGVDSSVSALLCKFMGYKTIGIFMRNWEEIDAGGVCTAEEDYKDVVRVCEQIDIPYYSVNFSQEYRDNVFASFLDEYKSGYTPNPDILCNREIKFKVFFNKAMELGADFLATGHYCQNLDGKLVKGSDKNKDQTYFLYTIKKDVLSKVLFPIGHLPKPKVREFAETYKLSTYNKKDSTGICFIGERNFKNFLAQYIQSTKGEFIELDTGNKLGQHDGMCFYTPGQRKGMGIGGPGGPWFVASKDVETNNVFVVQGESHPALYADYLLASDTSWVDKAPHFPIKLKAKIRYRQADQECLVENIDNQLKVTFTNPQRAISLRQSIVFYDDEVCLGGAIINKVGPSYFDMEKELTNI